MGEVSGLRRQARRFEHAKARTGARYPEAFREQALAVARERRRAGVPLARIARELGLRARTLSLWLRRVPKRRVRRVTLAGPSPSAAPASPLLVVRAGALVIEGLDLSSVVALLRALAA
jgi:transposase-like protein